MFGRNAVSDNALLKNVQKRLERTGMKTKLNATMRQGTVTITGQLQYEKQRMQIMNAVKGVSGIRQVVDQLQSPPKVKPQTAYAPSPARTVSPDQEAVAQVTVAEQANEHVAGEQMEVAAEVTDETVAN